MERGGDWHSGEFRIPPANLCRLPALGQDLGVDLCPQLLTPQGAASGKGTGSQEGLLVWVRGSGRRLPGPSVSRSQCRLGVTRLRLSLQTLAAWDGLEKLQE